MDPAPPSKRRSRRIQRENAVKIAIAEVARERAEARRRARLCVQWTYNGTRVAGVLTQLLVGGVQVWILGWGHAYDRESPPLLPSHHCIHPVFELNLHSPPQLKK